ncbi:beta-glucosidase [Streptomyces sp. NBC_00620]|uniref:beta-glucosidase family protein n=1 Tax=unclassified Streptomyces TaxID=2593676 RepID=UPI00225A18DE|nr:glycoside hydrolase family 3 N-terminal domain-containing protein [Streptomyces sp. NBC_00620]MCX4977152.1 glycoside hydrolase family 3 C-terminal domain-containing protein [Streptomyces sp. NBC_00620]WUC08791.1 glycoside hydrolase family 3 C-terminal domain-containing protein [Streptomyces sp. NBC_00564]
MTISDERPATTGLWNDPALPASDRARALLDVMTEAEKTAQLGSTWPGHDMAGDVAPMQDTFRGAESFDEAVVDGLGHVTRVFGTAPLAPEAGRERLAALQERVVAANRFGIPAIAHEECLTGFTTWQATVYPTPLAWAATFDPGLVHRMAAAIGSDMAAVGVHQGLSPVLDVVRDYRWGRVEETLGEDPYLVSELGLAYVQGLQSGGVVATLKHFAGYSASRAARNHAPAALGPRELADVVLVPFEKAVVTGRVGSVMNAYNDIDGVPCAADEALLTQLLRESWGFEGTVVSDYWAIAFLASLHHVAADIPDAARAALHAGIDVELPHTTAYGEALQAQLRDGRVPVGLLDRAVLRVLTQKAELGLLDPDWHPRRYTAPADFDSPLNRGVARALAEESVVLLDNAADLLPLTGARSVAVIGPTADDAHCLFGCYSFPNHVLPHNPEIPMGIEAPTVLDAIRREFPDVTVRYEVGCPVTGDDRSGVEAAVAAAAAADVTVLVVGDRSGMFGHGTSGEGCDVGDLTLPGMQDELVEAVLAAANRTVLVVVSGRPYAIGRHARNADATVQVFFPGEEGAAAIAGVISGRINPSGRLPVQIPGDMAGQPGTYLAPPLALKSDGVSNIDPTPAFPFGHGLSYTTFAIGDVHVNEAAVPVDATIAVRAAVSNTGERAGTFVPQLYLTDPVASVTRPVRQLIGFTRVDLAAGETRVVEFQVHTDMTSFTGRDLRRRVEPGGITFTVAQSAGDPGVPVQVTLQGDERMVDHTRTMTTPVTVLPG